MNKRILSMLLCLVMVVTVLALLPQTANAATAQETGNTIAAEARKQDGTFPATLPEGQTTYTAYCYACKAEKEWKPLTTGSTVTGVELESGAHLYLPTDLTNSVSNSRGEFMYIQRKTVCIHTNGKTFNDVRARRVFWADSASTLNIMGGGTIKGKPAGYRGVILTTNSSTVNIYGTTIESFASTMSDAGEAAICAYKNGSKVNVWSATVKGGAVESIVTDRNVNLYNSTVTGAAARIGFYDKDTGDGSTAKLNLVDTSITGVNVTHGAVTVSGNTKITDTGLALAEGIVVDPSGLTVGASIAIANKGVFTTAGADDYAKYFTPVEEDCVINVAPDGALRCWATGAVLVDAEGNESVAADILTAWKTGNYAYIKLYGDDSFAMNGEHIVVDLSGSDLTVTGSGNISVFDTANDAYDENACGEIINNGEVTIDEMLAAPNGNRYIAVTEGNRTTAHRLNIRMVAVSIRTTAAGLYYKAQYNCDDVLAKKVQAYGVIVSANNMPGADFATETGDINKATVASAPFKSGVTATSGSVFGIMKDSRSAATNDAYARTPIYANAYIDLGNGPIVGDTANPGKKVGDEGFTGVALSLYDAVYKVDAAYYSSQASVQKKIDGFCKLWKNSGMDWTFANIGNFNRDIDNSNLKFDEGTTNAMCPVCQKKVTWTGIGGEYDSVRRTKNGDHYYLTSDLTYTGAQSGYLVAPATSGHTACFHLNGHNITSKGRRPFWASSGVLNVMGEGEVTGGLKASGYSSAILYANGTPGGAMNFYGGTYIESRGGTKVVFNTNPTGGVINVYKGATIRGANNVAIYIDKMTSATNECHIGLYGCTMENAYVAIAGADPQNDCVATLEVIDTHIEKLEVAYNSNVILSGETVIDNMILAEDAKVAPDGLIQGASITVNANGYITESVNGMADNLPYFKAGTVAHKLSIKDGALFSEKNFTGKLELTDGKGVCPVCEKEVEWEALEIGTASITLEGKHYYLAEDQEYTGTELAAVIAPGTNKVACVHLNDHKLTATKSRAFNGSTGILNVFGSGTVTGKSTGSNGAASTVRINTGSDKGLINLYAGTYQQASNAVASEYTVDVNYSGGKINIYKDAIVKGNASGNAIRICTANETHTGLGIYGGQVDGDVLIMGANQEKGYTSVIELDNAKINGKLDIDGVNTVTLRHAPKIQMLELEQELTLLTLDRLEEGADITVYTDGIFTQEHWNAATYKNYFKGKNEAADIMVRNGALNYKINYEKKLSIKDGQAYCPVCEKTVTWTPITSTAADTNLTGQTHWYLTQDMTCTATGTSYLTNTAKGHTVCLNLNGCDLTATQTRAIFVSSGYINVMGSGTVSGYNASANQGTAIQANNGVATNGISLYSGTYTKQPGTDNSPVIAMWDVGGTVKIYEDALVDAGSSLAIFTHKAKNRNSEVYIYGATIKGNVNMLGANDPETYQSVLYGMNATITGKVTIAGTNEITFEGKTKIGRLDPAKGVLINFVDMQEGSAITVNADGVFTPYMELADDWLKYITCADGEEWIIVRDKTFYQGAKQQISAATEDDKTALNNAYAGKTVKYGEMHDHTNATNRADGNFSLAQWKAEMDRLGMDFATIVDHGQSQHMYHADWDPTYFVGGSEPATNILDSKADAAAPHYNMIFSKAEDLETLVRMWENRSGKTDKKKYFICDSVEDMTLFQDAAKYTEGLGGILFHYANFNTAEFSQLAKDVYACGGLFVLVHPEYKGYLNSSDPMDSFFADYTGFEITTGDGGNMMAQYNEKAYQKWIDLLELGKKVWATSGSDIHKLPNQSGLTTVYTEADHADTYIQYMRSGNFAPGWVGIRMNIGGTAMGGETSFSGKRLQFSVGDIYRSSEVDAYNTAPAYVEGHTYRVELYDDGGLLMSSTIDPTQMNYFAIDCDETAMFYRVVVWDETDNERIGVGNPIWNSAAQQ